MANNSKAGVAGKKRGGHFKKVESSNIGKRSQEAGSFKLMKSNTNKKKANSNTVKNKRKVVNHKDLELVAQEKYPEFSESIKRGKVPVSRIEKEIGMTPLKKGTSVISADQTNRESLVRIQYRPPEKTPIISGDIVFFFTLAFNHR